MAVKRKPTQTKKVQTNIAGYTAWAVEELARFEERSLADVVRWILELWVRDNQDFLDERGISVSRFREFREGAAAIRASRAGREPAP